jgi:transcriptional regulator with XRE-family HTH domain
MSREIFGVSTTFLGTAIKSLRKRRGWSQNKLARELGCSPDAVQNWELERRRVNLAAVQKMRDLCPDEETRSLFVVPKISSVNQSPRAKRPLQVGGDPELELLASVCLDGVNLIYEAAAAGHNAAREVLKDLADKLTSRGGNWRRMKYLRDWRKDRQD